MSKDDTLGDDLTVVNSLVYHLVKENKMDKKRKKTNSLFTKHKHHSPFRHLQIQFHIKAEFVMRQWYKHGWYKTTSNSATKDHAWNEISGRYVPKKITTTHRFGENTRR